MQLSLCQKYFVLLSDSNDSDLPSPLMYPSTVLIILNEYSKTEVVSTEIKFTSVIVIPLILDLSNLYFSAQASKSKLTGLLPKSYIV